MSCGRLYEKKNNSFSFPLHRCAFNSTPTTPNFALSSSLNSPHMILYTPLFCHLFYIQQEFEVFVLYLSPVWEVWGAGLPSIIPIYYWRAFSVSSFCLSILKALRWGGGNNEVGRVGGVGGRSLVLATAGDALLFVAHDKKNTI